MTTYSKTIIKVSIHLPDESPLFGENSTHISLEDEGGGIYLKIEQCHDNSEIGSVAFNDLEHLNTVVTAAKELLRECTRVSAK